MNSASTSEKSIYILNNSYVPKEQKLNSKHHNYNQVRVSDFLTK